MSPKLTRILAKLAVSALLLGLILWRLDVDGILRSLASYRAERVAGAAAVFLLASVIAVTRWRLFVPEVPFGTLVRLGFIGQFYGMLLPGQIAGEAVKAYRLAKGRTHITRLVGSVLVDRMIGTLSLLAMADVGYALSPSGLPRSLGFLLGALTFFIVAALVGLRVPVVYRVAMMVPRRLARGGQLLSRAAHPLAHAIDVWRDYAKAPGRLAAGFAIGLLVNGLVVAIYAILASDLGIRVATADWLWISAMVTFVVLVPITIAGLGLREGALIGCLGYLGVPGETAVALSLGVLAVGVTGALLGWIAEITDRVPAAGRGEGGGP